MSRPQRIEFAGALYHIVSRGIEKRDIFLADCDRNTFLNLLNREVKQSEWICHAYCLMDNHFHLLIETVTETLSKGMKHLKGHYAQIFNKKYKRVGHLFEGRFKSFIVDKDSYLLEVARYIVLNPVKAGMVSIPDQWKWSSYNATSGLCKPHPALTTRWILDCIGHGVENREHAYTQFVREGVPKQHQVDLDMFWKKMSEDPSNIMKVGEGAEKSINAKIVQNYDTHFLRPDLADLFKMTRDKTDRNSAIVKAFVEHQYHQNEIAVYLGLHNSTISKIIAN